MAYLDAVFARARVAPGPAPPDTREAIERRIGAALPAAFAELLLSDAWPTFLKRFSNGDAPIPHDRLKPGYGLLPFMVENQRACTWAVAIDEGPDPRVLVRIENGDWELACESFSLWLRCQVEDGFLLRRARFSAQAPPLSQATLFTLQSAFTEGPSTYSWPGYTNHRFFGDAVDLLLWDGEGQCDWWVAPRADPEAALRSIPRIDALAPSLYALRSGDEAALNAIRQVRLLRDITRT